MFEHARGSGSSGQESGPRPSPRQESAADKTHEAADDVSDAASDVDTSKVS